MVVALLMSRVVLFVAPSSDLHSTNEARNDPSRKPIKTTPSSHSRLSRSPDIVGMIPSQTFDPHLNLETNRILVIGTSTFSRPGTVDQAEPTNC